ncbi:MAG: PilZ domain-containing protein [Deltaproteobacteria bacterium]|nr:PilZ domain-containing protein [Deltaproteobacteria bacterium]
MRVDRHRECIRLHTEMAVADCQLEDGPKRWPVSILTSHSAIEGEAEDISPTGIVISSQQFLPPGHTFSMMIGVPNRMPLNVTGRVVWMTVKSCDNKTLRFGIGVQFLSISKRDQQVLKGQILGH